MSSRIQSAWRGLMTVAVLAASGTREAGAQAADSLLERLALLARETAPAVVARRSDLLALSAAMEAAAPLPPPVLSAEVENVPDGARIDQAQVQVGAEFLVFRGGRADALRSAAGRRRDAASAALILEERRAEAGVRRSLVGYLAARASEARLSSEDSLLAEGEKALQLRFEQGEARYVDVLRLRTARLQLATDRSSVQALAVTRRQQVLGLLPDSLRATGSAMMDSLERARLPGESLLGMLPPDSSAVTVLLQALQAAAAAGVSVARAGRQTEIFGFAGVQRFIDAANRFQVGPMLAVSVALPFLTPGSNRTTIAAAESGRNAAVVTLEARRIALDVALLQARSRYEAARTRLDAISAVLLVGARREREAALAAYRSGQLSLLEFLDFERAIGRADLARLEALVAAADAAADLDELPADILLDLAPGAGAS